MSIELILFVALFSTALISFAYFSFQQITSGRDYHSRVVKDGGSPLLGGRFVMSYAYWLLTPIEKLISKTPITPNFISLCCLLLSFGAGFLVIQKQFLLAAVVWFFGSAMDALDGLVARAKGLVSEFGSVLDSTVDRISELSIYSAFCFLYRENVIVLGLGLLALWGSVLTSYVSAKGEILQVKMPRGWMRRAERAIYMGLLLVLTPFWSESFATHQNEWVQHLPVISVLGLIGLISLGSSFYRLVWLYHFLKASKQVSNSTSQKVQSS